MGRIGSGEMVTIAFGLMGPLLYLALGVLLMLWGRHQARAGKGTAAKIGWLSPLGGIGAALAGGIGTAVLLMQSFDDVGLSPPESRSVRLADGISNAMNALALGMSLSIILYVVSLIANLIASARPRPAQTTTPPP